MLGYGRIRGSKFGLVSELAALPQPLLRFATLQRRNDSAAEDVVSETMLAILEKPDNFEGRSSLRTYATGILEFKIIDVIRKRGREVHVEPLDEQSMDDAMDALFAADGHWAEPPPPGRIPTRLCSRVSSSTLLAPIYF